MSATAGPIAWVQEALQACKGSGLSSNLTYSKNHVSKTLEWDLDHLAQFIHQLSSRPFLHALHAHKVMIYPETWSPEQVKLINPQLHRTHFYELKGWGPNTTILHFGNNELVVLVFCKTVHICQKRPVKWFKYKLTLLQQLVSQVKRQCHTLLLQPCYCRYTLLVPAQTVLSTVRRGKLVMMFMSLGFYMVLVRGVLQPTHNSLIDQDLPSHQKWMALSTSYLCVSRLKRECFL